MLPKSKLGRAMFHKLGIRGQKHPHQAQKPQALSVKKKSPKDKKVRKER
jgi:ribosomal protein L13